MPKEIIAALCKQQLGFMPVDMDELPQSGSYRRYFRIPAQGRTFIGAYNEDVRENQAFLEYSRHFRLKGIPVPEVYAQSTDLKAYILEDLGNETLLDYYESHSIEESLDMYAKAVRELLKLQVRGGEGLDYSVAYPRAAFDRQSMLWDMYYFKYHFLKLARVPFDEQFLEDDFQRFADFLWEADHRYFLFRDFQSRNIMIREGNPWFIDYQGGRQGSLCYDIASVLFESRTFLPEAFRAEILDVYRKELSDSGVIELKEFDRYFYPFAIIRTMQAMGAYGFRGLYEKKSLFLQSIPSALEHMKWFTRNIKLQVELPELMRVLLRLEDVDPNIAKI